MEQTDGETAALTSPEDIKAQMKVAIADFQAGPHCVVLRSVLKKYQSICKMLIENIIVTQKYIVIPNFQSFAGLKPTGKMDKQTKILMNTPR